MTTIEEAQDLADRLSRVLHDEIAAIGRGQLGDVVELATEKAQLMQEVEAVFADGVPLFSGASRAAADRLRTRLTEVQELVAKDLAMLERMTEATGAIAAELTRIRDRHNRVGLYGPDGARHDGDVAKTQRLDRSL